MSDAVTSDSGTNEVAIRQDGIAQYNGDVLAMAVDRDLDIDKLRALIQMRAEEEARQARLAYAEEFARMQSEFTAVSRSKQGYDYRYAPIEVLQKAYGPIIARHRFSYRWREEALEVGKRVIMTISGHGHSEDTSFDIPKLEGTKQMNPVQVAGAMSTYGRRYTFIAGFGVIIDDEDTDATFEDGVKYADFVNAIEAETDLPALHEMTKRYRAQLRDERDEHGVDIITRAYTKRKEALQ